MAARPSALLVCVVAPAIAACPLPVKRTEALSGPVSGQVIQADGTARAGAAVVVSTEWDDTLCAAAAARTTTDSNGGFQLPGTQKHYSVTWVIPMMDRFAPGYRLCVSVADTLRVAYHGWGSLHDTAPRDSVTCLEWAWQGRSRVTCSGLAEHAIATGGRWTDADASGWYRLILAYEPTVVPNRRRPELRPHAYVQWVEHSETGPPYNLRAITELEIDRKATALWETAIWLHDGRWYASLLGTRKTFMNDFHGAEYTYRLGPPGDVSRAEVR